MPSKLIASFDGGGVRGAYTAAFLVSLEAHTGKLCRDIFSMVSGTSTGAIIAASVAVGLPATEILTSYVEDVPGIFNLPEIEAWPVRLAKGYAYSSDKVRAVMVKRFSAQASVSLNDLPIRVLICATRINGDPLYFVKDLPTNAGTTGKLSLIDCATASAAAPTYLSPVYVPPLGGILIGWAVDGGVSSMACPVYQTCVEAFAYDNFDPSATRVISFGTGTSADLNVNPPNGFISTLSSLVIDSLLYNAGRQQLEIAERHYPGVVQRINGPLSSNVDMADASAIPSLVKSGQAAAALIDWDKILNV